VLSMTRRAIPARPYALAKKVKGMMGGSGDGGGGGESISRKGTGGSGVGEDEEAAAELAALAQMAGELDAVGDSDGNLSGSLAVGPGRHCPLHHPTHLELSFLNTCSLS